MDPCTTTTLVLVGCIRIFSFSATEHTYGVLGFDRCFGEGLIALFNTKHSQFMFEFFFFEYVSFVFFLIFILYQVIVSDCRPIGTKGTQVQHNRTQIGAK